MMVTFGLKAHSGWAALVVVGKLSGDFVLVDRRRLDLVEETWAKQPYHAAENLEAAAACELVRRGIEAAHRIAVREMRAAMERERERGNEIAACAVLTGNPMPDWSADEILAVHIRMHRAEGVLFRDALCRAAEDCAVRLVATPEKQLMKNAVAALGIPESSVIKKLAVLGRTAGPPWARDQKDAALAAMIAAISPTPLPG